MQNKTRKKVRGRANSNTNTEFQSPQVVPLTDEQANEPTNEITNELKIQGNLSKKEIEILQKEFFDSVKHNQLDKHLFILLFKDCVNINLEDEDGMTALIWAAWFGYTDICKLLVDYGADVNIQDKNGDTALIGVLRYIDTVKYLLSVGANPLLKNKNGITAYDWTSNKEIKLIIKEHMKIWELIGEEKALLIKQLVRNCEPSWVEEIIKNL